MELLQSMQVFARLAELGSFTRAADAMQSVVSADIRQRGWHLRTALPGSWQWLLRLNPRMDYAYMLYPPVAKTETYRADSADHYAVWT